MTKPIEDIRSTGRKHLRRNYQKFLADTEGVWQCADCKRGPSALPHTLVRDHPDWAAKINLAPVEFQVNNLMIEIDHADKDLENADPANATALCVPCHKKRDLSTGKGESRLSGDSFGHDPEFFLSVFGIEDDPNFATETVSESQRLLQEIIEP